ncbi:YdcF family protein [Fluoribacter dumoffii]|uniref:DUF218 domain n=1 Tax=Fluoribacter dumoffii TaxID=463 RepID=A0A377GEA2_9GAMM|nr:YdcF family protein [Fluoribacter dumoffii]KTC91423.1 hypothetical protein Ldum_2491 [Fluoribacter dumoffii NY 23]STO23127.1 DUF218 domain [Fluoribacter dumoffii]
MENIILILGSYNNDHGELSHIAISRLMKGISDYKEHINSKILITGGCGDHFNRTDKPHTFYAKRFLMENKISRDDILGEVESTYTLEDALLAKEVIDKHSPEKIIIVTSDFHMSRVQFIFNSIFNNYQLQYSAATTCVSTEEYNVILSQEEKKLEAIKQKIKGYPNGIPCY